MDRPDLYVVARFLDILHDSQYPMKKTNLQMMSRQNYPRFAEYLDWLIDHGLVTLIREGEDELVVLSPKGTESWRRLVGWITETMEGFRI